eukprot:CAMPEP_0197009520 /NCGR_PEP_ID=MMETSP1380-20130617/50517_1 /TAXON_ID=5936 /ORGANISM="Euplotes crassus, Strain CT5" /LENGTH=278 /DNA_ID=CAMNT_0042430839 /DNA_START=275 /DNA_END=1112 /DNA_ORIENTATION=-
MLVKKVPKKLMKRGNKFTVKPAKTTEGEHNALVEVGFSNIPELKIQNPYLKRQERIAFEQTSGEFAGKDLNFFKDIRLKENDMSLKEQDSVEPQFTSTFNASIPFKDTFMDLSETIPANQGISTIYNETSRQSKLLESNEDDKNNSSNANNKPFLFNPEKAKIALNETKDSPNPKKVKLKLSKKTPRKPKETKNKITITARDRGIVFAKGIKKPKSMRDMIPKKYSNGKVKMMDADLNTIKDEGELEEASSIKSIPRCVVDPNKMRLVEQTIRMLNEV